MDNTNISPVSEQDMRSVFDRFVTQFVSLSEQAKQLVELRSRFDALDGQVRNLVSDNESLRNQVQTLVSERDKARAEANDNASTWHSEATAHDETKRKLQEAEERIRWYQSDTDNLRKVNAEQGDNISSLRQQLSSTNDRASAAARDAEYWTGQAKTFASQRDEAKAKLEKIQSVFQEQVKEAQQAIAGEPSHTA